MKDSFEYVRNVCLDESMYAMDDGCDGTSENVS